MACDFDMPDGVVSSGRCDCHSAAAAPPVYQQYLPVRGHLFTGLVPEQHLPLHAGIH